MNIFTDGENYKSLCEQKTIRVTDWVTIHQTGLLYR